MGPFLLQLRFSFFTLLLSDLLFCRWPGCLRDMGVDDGSGLAHWRIVRIAVLVGLPLRLLPLMTLGFLGIDLLLDVQDLVLCALDYPHDCRVWTLLAFLRLRPIHLLFLRCLLCLLSPLHFFLLFVPEPVVVSSYSCQVFFVLAGLAVLVQSLLVLPLCLLPFDVLDFSLSLLSLCYGCCFLLLLSLDLFEA